MKPEYEVLSTIHKIAQTIDEILNRQPINDPQNTSSYQDFNKQMQLYLSLAKNERS